MSKVKVDLETAKKILNTDKVFLNGKNKFNVFDGGKYNSGFTIVIPQEWDLNVDERISASIDAPEYSIGSNGYLLLDYSGKHVTIAIGNRVEQDEEYVYITKTGDPDILVVHSGALSLLPKDAGAFSDTLLFQAYYPQIKSIEASLGKDYFSLLRTENGWLYDGKNIIKEEKAQNFMEELLSSEAEGFVEDEHIKLPQRPTASITLKINRRSITRYFFSIPTLHNQYLMPLKGRILYVDKEIVKRIFSWTGR